MINLVMVQNNIIEEDCGKHHPEYFFLLLTINLRFIIAWKEGCRLQLISLVDLILHFGKCFACIMHLHAFALLCKKHEVK